MSLQHGESIVFLDASPATALDPVTLTEAKSHMRVDTTADDALIQALISAARQQIESLTGRRLMAQTICYYLEDWPDEDYLELPIAPLASVTSVVYTDVNDLAATWAVTNYRVDTYSPVPRLALREGADWPDPAAGLREVNGIAITMEVGYGTSDQVPEPLKLAIKMLVAHYYEHREDTTPLNISQVPFGVFQLIQPYRQVERLL